MKEGDKVYLLRRNIKMTRPSDKLDHVKIGPFRIQEQTGKVNYRLELPKGMRIHPVFHVSLLEPAPRNTKVQTKINIVTSDEYEVERILDSRLVDGLRQYLVKWKGYDDSENTWEPKTNLKNCWALLKCYHQQNPEPTQRSQT